MPHKNNVSVRAGFWGGCFAGWIAGAIMLLTWMAAAVSDGAELLDPLQWVGGSTGAGLLIHFVVSGLLGAAFGMLIGWQPPGFRDQPVGDRALVSGLAYGVLVWAVMTWIVLPFVNPTMKLRVESFPVWWFLLHMIYGSTLLLAPVFRRKILVRSLRSDFAAGADKAA